MGEIVRYKQHQHRRKPSRLARLSRNLFMIGSITGLAAVGSYLYETDSLPPFSLPSFAALGLDPSCNIKGNISINSGERIYHVPGQEYYFETNISPEYGERWFCLEQEARAAGWRRARN